MDLQDLITERIQQGEIHESVSCGEGKIIVGLRTKSGGMEGRRTTCLN